MSYWTIRCSSEPPKLVPMATIYFDLSMVFKGFFEIRENVKKRGSSRERKEACVYGASSFIQIRALLSYCFPFLLSEGIIMVHLSLDG